ncbi:hypothetical protein M9Y10_017147 [Tritrichomonas musculus]|uniref:Uncharacterized protein n=1 Tax=Tritrichomonas musculus TaxID=1915356 RepID=A0ABR2HVG5_9EUKA
MKNDKSESDYDEDKEYKSEYDYDEDKDLKNESENEEIEYGLCHKKGKEKVINSEELRKKENKLKKKIALQKKKLFNNIINGVFDPGFVPYQKVIDDKNAHNFMTFLLQPLVWHFPIIVIHLSKSENGSFDINNAYELNAL